MYNIVLRNAFCFKCFTFFHATNDQLKTIFFSIVYLDLKKKEIAKSINFLNFLVEIMSIDQGGCKKSHIQCDHSLAPTDTLFK